MSSSRLSSETRLRLRALLHAQFTVIVAVCLLATAVGAGLVYTTHVDPGTETETRTVSSFTVETEYVHSAEVTEPNPVFETGTVLEGRNTYFMGVAPELDVGVETRYTATAASDVDVGVESVLVLRNVGEEGETVYWSEREPLASEQFSDVESGETVAASFVINSSEIDATATSIEEELGASPGETETVVVSNVAVNGTFGGEPTSYTRTTEMTVEHGEGTYSVSEPGLQSETPERTTEITVERDYGPLRSIGGPFLLLLGIAGTAALVYVRSEIDLALTPDEEAYLSYHDDRSEFAEWITQIRLPDSVFERPQAQASSLRDLVDFAIDNDTGVVEDPETGAFYAVAGDFVYTYHPPSPVDSAPDEGVGGSETSDADLETADTDELESDPEPDGPSADSGESN
ncbi:DUF5305 domain-containing protein [Halobellus litoreus]|uniref:DUF5305 domain-containing protein n=1 Tax=Halobellus litoreus TaxID=755310 RepID=A0ABD6E3G7_9EURY|nr:DUF5305 domain-containing protein [Halobellus litoreus]